MLMRPQTMEFSQTMLACAVVIVNYNAGPLLINAARAAQRAGASEIVVVDNASTDGSVEALLAADIGPVLAVIRNAANLGFAAGCNIGATASKAPLVLFLNPDCSLEPTALHKMATALMADDHIGMVGPLLLNPDSTEQRGGRRRIPTPLSGFTHGFGLSRMAPALFDDFNQTGDALPAGPTPVEAISGSCMMVRRTAAAAVGPWDEGYFLHGEDLDYCLRFSRAGFAIIFVPDAIATHVRGASSSGRPLFVEWHKHQSMMRFYDKFFAASQPLPVRWLVKSGIAVRLAFKTAAISVGRLLGRA
jgi:GT2 family glycosyltransferase